MPSPKPSRFSSFEFTEQEMKSACVFNPLQKMHLQNKQCEIAESLLNIEAATTEEMQSAELNRAYLKGQLAVLSYLLEFSESMEINIRDEDTSHDYVVNRAASDNNLFDPSNPTSEGE